MFGSRAYRCRPPCNFNKPKKRDESCYKVNGNMDSSFDSETFTIFDENNNLNFLADTAFAIFR